MKYYYSRKRDILNRVKFGFLIILLTLPFFVYQECSAQVDSTLIRELENQAHLHVFRDRFTDRDMYMDVRFVNRDIFFSDNTPDDLRRCFKKAASEIGYPESTVTIPINIKVDYRIVEVIKQKDGTYKCDDCTDSENEQIVIDAKKMVHPAIKSSYLNKTKKQYYGITNEVINGKRVVWVNYAGEDLEKRDIAKHNK